MGYKKIITDKYVNEYNNVLSKKALAKKLYNENPLYFKDEEEARYFIRRSTGATGTSKPAKKIEWNIPEGDNENYSDFTLSQGNALILSDIHFPYHSNSKIEKALNKAISDNCNQIILNGDSLDCYYLSSHEKEPSKRSFAEELVYFQEFLSELKKNFPVPIYFKIGNHEARWERFLKANPHIWDMKEFELKSILKFGEHNITEIKSNQAISLGNVFTLYHGHEYQGSAGIWPAKWLFERSGKSSACGHFHRSSNFRANNGTQVETFSIGCLCDLQPKYLTHQRYTQKWNHGYAIISYDNSGFDFKNIIL